VNVLQVWRIWGAGLAVVALPVLLWGGAAPPERDPRDVGDLIKDVPAVPVASVLAADVAELENSLLWGAAAGAAAPSATADEAGSAPEWTLGGVFMKDDRRQVVVRFAAETPPALLGEGDVLPDGARILSIARDKVRVELPGEADGTRWLTVNRGGPSGPSAGD
jgi:hypothetical protein